MAIQKYHIYKMWKSDGTYLGVLQGVTTPFVLTQDINTLGPSPITIGVAQNADTTYIPVRAILSEDGRWITTEDGRGLTTEGEQTNYAVDKTKIRNGNRIRVTEVSDYHPAGLVVFDGTVRKWNVNFGTNDDSTLYATPRSFDMNGHLVKPSEQLTLSQTAQTSAFSMYDGINGRRYDYLFYFNPAGITNLSTVKLLLAAMSATSTTVTLTLYKAVSSSESISVSVALDRSASSSYFVASKTIDVSGTSPVEYSFVFDTPIQIESNWQYGLLITCSGASSTGANVYFTTSNALGGTYNDTQWSNLNDGSGWYFGVWDTGGTLRDSNGDLYFKFYSIPTYTKATITSFDPSALLLQTIKNYNSEGGVVTTTTPSVQNTGTSITSYTFSVNTISEGLNTLLGMAPRGFYYTIDPGTNILTFKSISTTADVTLRFKRHINNLDLSATIENIENNVYFTGALVSGANIFVQQQNTTSQSSYGVTIGRINDPHVTSTTVGTTLAATYLDKNDDELYETTVVVADNTTDITQFKPGMTIGFSGFGTFADTLILPIVRIERSYDSVTLMLGSLPKRQATMLNDIQSQVEAQTTVDNPNQPS